MPVPLERLSARSAALDALSETLARWRGAAFLVTAALVIAGTLWVPVQAVLWTAAGATGAAFAFLVARYRKVAKVAELFKIRRALELRLQANQALDWKSIPELPALPADRVFPNSFDDLDIVQGQSLARLLNLTFSTLGFRKLLERFDSNGISRAELLRRRELVTELQAMRVPRRKLLVHARLSGARIDAERIAFLIRESFVLPGWKAPFAALFALQATAFAAFGWFFFQGGRPYFLAPALGAVIAFRVLRRRILASEAFGGALSLSNGLATFRTVAAILTRLAHGPRPGVREALRAYSRERSPQDRLRRLERVVTALGVKQNPIAHLVFNLAFPWDFFWTLRLDALRRHLGDDLPAWLDALAETEAATALAEFACANPGYVRPVLLPDESDVFVSAEELAHPLIPASVRVGNGLELTARSACDLITGSNMSGKSTFLRSTGVAILLAKAGTTVPARAFAFRHADLVTSLRPVDSLSEGASSFYAEVRQLKDILDHARSGTPAVYLIDEVFRGTNNRERLAGSTAYIKALLQTGAAGLITTHDLELAKLEETSKRLRNWHFRDAVENGRMTFSYRKHPGPCPTTNALKVMALAGLPVEP